MKLRIFTDGACSGNPGPGGWAALFAFPNSHTIVSGHKEETTNNEMELIAVVRALVEVLEEEWDNSKRVGDTFKEIEICSDSAYVVNTVNKGWLAKWSTNGWRTTDGDQVKNSAWWQEVKIYLAQAKREGIQINFIKVKGHSGVTLNELVDERARNESLIAKKKVEARKNVVALQTDFYENF